MRRVLALLVLTLLVSPAAAAAGGSEIVFHTAEFSYDDLVPGICEFPIRFVGTQEHWQKLQYRNLPDGLGTDEPGAEVYQVAGWHFTSTRETISNPANGRSVDLHSEDQLMRRDFDFHFTYDALGQPTGYFTATDHNSYSYTATARGGPPVFKYAGHERRSHTSFFVDGVRVGRIDDPFFTNGVYRDSLCEYLAG